MGYHEGKGLQAIIINITEPQTRILNVTHLKSVMARVRQQLNLEGY